MTSTLHQKRLVVISHVLPNLRLAIVAGGQKQAALRRMPLARIYVLCMSPMLSKHQFKLRHRCRRFSRLAEYANHVVATRGRN